MTERGMTRETGTGDSTDRSAEADLDGWAELHQRDPAGFETRRRTVLALETARTDAIPAPERPPRHLDLDGEAGQERLRQSMAWMIASMRQLGEKVARLGEAVEELQRASRTGGRRGAIAPRRSGTGSS